MKKICGIYKITNMINNKCYIGQSINIKIRWKNHRINAKSKKHTDKLYIDIRKYNINNFKFEILEECKKEDLDTKEKYWINYYKSTDDRYGYNTAVGGKIHMPKFKMKDEITSIDVENIKDDLKNNLISISEISLKYNVHKTDIYKINSGELFNNISVHYPIRNIDEHNFMYDKLNKPSSIELLARTFHLGSVKESCLFYNISQVTYFYWSNMLDIPSSTKFILPLFEKYLIKTEKYASYTLNNYEEICGYFSEAYKEDLSNIFIFSKNKYAWNINNRVFLLTTRELVTKLQISLDIDKIEEKIINDVITNSKNNIDKKEEKLLSIPLEKYKKYAVVHTTKDKNKIVILRNSTSKYCKNCHKKLCSDNISGYCKDCLNHIRTLPYSEQIKYLPSNLSTSPFIPNNQKELFIFLYYNPFSVVAKHYSTTKKKILIYLEHNNIPNIVEDYRLWFENNYKDYLPKDNKQEIIRKIYIQKSLDNSYIAEYTTLSEAARSINKGIYNHGAHIKAAAISGNIAYGYRWEIKEHISYKYSTIYPDNCFL